MRFSNCHHLVLVILFVIALLPRLYQLDKTTIYPDEISWTVRGKELIFALKQQNWKYFDSVWWKSTKENESIAIPLTLLSGASTTLLGQGQSKLSLNVFLPITAARIPIAFLNALVIPIFYLLTKRFVSQKIAFLSAVLLSIDPIHLSLSRWVMLDGLLTLFTVSSLYFFILSLENRKWIPLAGLCLSLGFLTKPLGILPIIAWVFIWLTNKYSFKDNSQVLIRAILSFLFFTWLLLPGSWNKPIIAIFEYLIQQSRLGQTGYLIYFMGETTTQPPFYFYLYQIFMRLPTLILLISLLSIIFIPKKNIFSERNYLAASLVIFFTSFLFIISLTPLKLGVRYALPVWPGVYLLTAWIISQLFDIFRQKLLQGVIILTILATAIPTLIEYFPDYYLFYNSIIGGPGNAQKYDLVGHCLGSKPSLEYIKKCYSQEESVAILGCSSVTAPYYFTQAVSNKWQEADITIIEYTYKQLLPNQSALDYFSKQKPAYTAISNGATLSQVYSKTHPKDTCSQLN